MPIPKEEIMILEIDKQKWIIRFTPYCFILATDKTKIVFDYPDDKLPTYTEETEFTETGNIIIGILKTDLYTMHVSATDNILDSLESGSIDMVGMLANKLLPSFTFPIPYSVARNIQQISKN